MAQPGSYLARSGRVGRVHRRGVTIDGSSDAVVSREDEHPCHDQRPPAESAKDQCRSEALFHVEDPIRLLKRADDALDLNDSCCPITRMDAEHIDGSAFAELRE